jgi:hypothetical protein
MIGILKALYTIGDAPEDLAWIVKKILKRNLLDFIRKNWDDISQ